MRRHFTAWECFRRLWLLLCDERRLILTTPFFCLFISDGARDYYFDRLWWGVEIAWGPNWWPNGLYESEYMFYHERRWERSSLALWRHHG